MFKDHTDTNKILVIKYALQGNIADVRKSFPKDAIEGLMQIVTQSGDNDLTIDSLDTVLSIIEINEDQISKEEFNKIKETCRAFIKNSKGKKDLEEAEKAAEILIGNIEIFHPTPLKQKIRDFVSRWQH